MSPTFHTSLLSDCAFIYSSRDLVTKSREVLLAELENNPTIDRQMLLLQELIKREGEDFKTREGSLKDMVDLLYQRAAYDRKWSAVRRGAGILKKLVDSLAPGITTILVSDKVVSNIFKHKRQCFIGIVQTPRTEFLMKFEVFGNVVKHWLECLKLRRK